MTLEVSRRCVGVKKGTRISSTNRLFSLFLSLVLLISLMAWWFFVSCVDLGLSRSIGERLIVALSMVKLRGSQPVIFRSHLAACQFTGSENYI